MEWKINKTKYQIKQKLNRIEKELMNNHYNLINKHIECAKQYIEIKKQILELYQSYNKNIVLLHGNKALNNFYMYNIEYINHLEYFIKQLEFENTNQKKFFKNNIFYLSKF